MPEFTMPSLGADMDEGLVQEWLVRPGQHVDRGDVVAVIETAKSTIEAECFHSGTVERLLVEPGTTVPVGTALAVIGADRPQRRTARQPRSARPSHPPSAEPAPAGRPHGTPGTPQERPDAVGEPVATPLVRALADERGLDLARLHGSGPGGRVTKADVEHAAPAPAPAPRVHASPLARRLAEELKVRLEDVPGTGRNGVVRASDVRKAAGAPAPQPDTNRTRRRERPAAMRRTTGDLMARSKREIPHYYLSTSIDLGGALGWMREQNRSRPASRRLVPAALLLKAAATAAQRVPELNGYWQEGAFVAGSGVHLGVAISLRDGGLLVPALHDADTLSLADLMTALKDLVDRARTGRLRASETTGATITVTNLGDQGVESVFGVIYPPQVALVGFGAVVERPCAVDGLIGVRPAVTATLSADHRATDGATGGRYLTTVDRLLQRPEEL
ncbi:dihydrolipoamide acetyltransferase family protein [Actinacidiphila glaucinigra]|uniref:dihydrolipoamide acetyltransferase family protein n=1 Tax=Actinacidiphila glaucinigra TaxID=235986 RepID=UPI003720E928